MSSSREFTLGENDILIGILRRDPSQLMPAELEAVQAKFPGKNLVFKRLDSTDAYEHAKLCRTHRPTAVILPRDRPIPSIAMEEGFQHIALIDGEMKELDPLVAMFHPFQPR